MSECFLLITPILIVRLVARSSVECCQNERGVKSFKDEVVKRSSRSLVYNIWVMTPL